MPTRSPTDEFGALAKILLAMEKKRAECLSLRSTIISCGFTQKTFTPRRPEDSLADAVTKKKLFHEILMPKKRLLCSRRNRLAAYKYRQKMGPGSRRERAVNFKALSGRKL